MKAENRADEEPQEAISPGTQAWRQPRRDAKALLQSGRGALGGVMPDSSRIWDPENPLFVLNVRHGFGFFPIFGKNDTQ